MKDLYYNLDDAEFVDQSGEKLSRFVPELFYQENAVWRIFLRDRDNRPRDLSGIVAWSAAVDCDYSAATAPMCRVTTESISADAATGAVTVTLDAATAEFLAAVNGTPKRRAFFELHGLTAAGDRELYLGFEICARMILDPSPGAPQEVPEIFATKIYTDLTARRIAEEVLSSGGQVSGAIVSGAEFVTTVGSFTLSYTSGGFLVSGGGVQFQVSGGAVKALAASYDEEQDTSRFMSFSLTSGAIVASGANYESVVLAGGTAKLLYDYDGVPQYVAVHENGVDIHVSDPGRNVNIECCPGSVTVNSRPVLTELESATDTATTSAYFAELAGGTSFIYTQPISAFDVTSITSDCRAAMEFTAGAAFTPGLPASCVLFGSNACSSGGHYVVAVNGNWVVVNEGKVLSAGV